MASIFDTIDPAMLRRIQALRLMDDDFMTVVFSGDNKLTEFLLRILLGRDDLHVRKSMTQKEKRNIFGRSVRLDIMAEDTEGKLYNIEIQRADKGAGARRVRYNIAAIDFHTLKKNDDVSKLPELYVIFITESDYLGLGEPFYKVKKIFDSKDANGDNLPFDDGCNIIYVNGEYRGDDAVGRLMHDFSTADASRMYYSEIAERVRFHKQEEKGVGTMCRIFEEYGNEREAEGEAKGRIGIAENLLKKEMPVEEISEVTGLTIEQVKELAEKLTAVTTA